MNQLSESQLSWLKQYMVIGEHHIFEDMVNTTKRIKEETQKTRNQYQDKK